MIRKNAIIAMAVLGVVALLALAQTGNNNIQSQPVALTNAGQAGTIAAVKTSAPLTTDGAVAVSLSPNTGIPSCDTTKVTALTTTTAVVLVPATAGKTTYVCSWELSSVASAATAVQIIAGTQVTNPCDTGTVTLSSLLQLPITTPTTFIEGSGFGSVIRGTAQNQQLCATESVAATSVSLTVHYTQF